MEKKSVKIQILGIDYSLKSDEEPEYVKMVAKYVEEKIQRLTASTNVKSQTKIAVLAALNIADEYFQLKKSRETVLQKLKYFEARSEELCDKADNYLSQYTEILEE